MRKPTAGCPRSLNARAAFAALAIAAAAAAPAVVFAAAIHPTDVTVIADPNDGPPLPQPPGDPVSYTPQYNYAYDDYYYIPDGGGGGGAGGG